MLSFWCSFSALFFHTSILFFIIPPSPYFFHTSRQSYLHRLVIFFHSFLACIPLFHHDLYTFFRQLHHLVILFHSSAFISLFHHDLYTFVCLQTNPHLVFNRTLHVLYRSLMQVPPHHAHLIQAFKVLILHISISNFKSFVRYSDFPIPRLQTPKAFQHSCSRIPPLFLPLHSCHSSQSLPTP